MATSNGDSVYEKLRTAPDRAAALRRLSDTDVVEALATAQTRADAPLVTPLLAEAARRLGNNGAGGHPRHQDEHQRQRQRQERRARQHETVARLGLDALQRAPLEALFDRCVDELRALLDVEYTKVLQLDSSGKTLTLRAGRGWDDDIEPNRSQVGAGGESQAGYTLATREPVVVRDLRNDHRFTGPPLLREHGVVSGMSVIIHGAGGPWGVLGAHTREEREFDADEVNFLQSLANVLAGAIQRDESDMRLERRARERTIQLEQAMRDLQTFTDSVSHDLRAPLRGAAALLQFLHDDHAALLPQEGRQLLEKSQAEVARASRLVRDLLGFSRSSHAPLHRVDVDVSAIANTVARDVSANHPEWRTTWDIEENLHAHADEGLMRILLHNLLHNAAKYSARADSPRVQLRRDRRTRRATFVVQDNGVGFPMSEAYRLFQPFARLSTANGIEGTGLGLATAHRIITRHGGTLVVESEPGEGAAFRFTLEPPASPAPADE